MKCICYLMLLWSISAMAQDRVPRIQIVPTEGAWVSDSVPNTGWFFDVDEADFGFVAWYTYDAQGRSTFLVMQGQVQYRSETARRATGIVASLGSTIFEADNGACPTCPPRPANIRPSSFGTGEIVWRSARRGSIAYAGQLVELRPFTQTVQEADIVEGLWQLNNRSYSTVAEFKSSAIVRIKKAASISLHSFPSDTPNGPARDPSFYAFGPLPTSQAGYYTFECVSGCDSNGDFTGSSNQFSTSRPASWVMWVEGGAFYMQNYFVVNPAFFPTAFQICGQSVPTDVFPSQDRIVMRRRGNRATDTGFLYEIQLTRLPSNWLDAN